MRLLKIVFALFLLWLLASCNPAPPPPRPGLPPTRNAPPANLPTNPPASPPTNPTAAATVSGESESQIDRAHLPIGDGRLANSPTAGWIWPCRTNPAAGGAFTDGPWIRDDGTYDYTAKATVDGAISWGTSFAINLQGDQRIFASNDLPNHPTGTYPIAPNDDAYQYDRNPNRIAGQNVQVELPADPALATQPSCVPGAIGILLTGSVLFNALDAPGRDAVAHEIQDGCQGHPQEFGVYHYHSLTDCLADLPTGDGHSALMGYILDGFGIYGYYGEGGRRLTSADLDECHGHTHQIEWDGSMVEMYHYHATWDFPYTVGCIRGTVAMADVMALSGGGGPPNPGN